MNKRQNQSGSNTFMKEIAKSDKQVGIKTNQRPPREMATADQTF